METKFEHSDEEIDVVTVDPNDERIINFDVLTRDLSFDCDKESDYHTDTDSNNEDVTIDVVNTSPTSLEIYDNESRRSSLQDESKSLDETIEIPCEEAPSEIRLKRKRQNTDESIIKSRSKRKQINENQSNYLWNYFDKSMSESSKAITTPQMQRALSSPTKINPIESSKSKKNSISSTKEGKNMPSLKAKLPNINDIDATDDHDDSLLVADASYIIRYIASIDDELECILKCTNCNFKVKETDRYSEKCPKCMSNFAFSCKYCATTCLKQRSLIHHLRNKHEKTRSGPIQCPACNHTYKTKNMLKLHLRICCKSVLRVCCFCSFVTKRAQEIHLHLESKHADQIDTREELEAVFWMILKNGESIQDKLKCIILTCTNCNLKIQSTDRYSKKCPKCSSYFALSCEKCSKQLSGLCEAINHLNNKCVFKYHYCNDCDSKFTAKSSLARHIKEMHISSTELVQCPNCHASSKRKRFLENHMRYCNKLPHLRCCFCSYTSKQNKDIKQHLKNKHMERFDMIEVFEATYRKILQDGDRKTSKYSNYCLECKKIVDITGTYDNRQCLVCKSDSVLQCNKCGEHYRNYSSLIYHVNTVCYPGEILSCDHCDYTTPLKFSLRFHIVNQHMHMPNGVVRKSQRYAHYCPKCKKMVKVTGILSKKQDKKCLECKTPILFHCNKCGYQHRRYRHFMGHLNRICYIPMIE